MNIAYFFRHRFCLIPVMGILAGCTPELGPAATEKPLSMYDTAQSFAAQSGDWPQEAWWQSYNDSQLDHLIEAGLAGAPSLAVAKARLLEARGLAKQQGASALPTVSASGVADEVHFNKTSIVPFPAGFQSIGEASLDFAYDFDFWGRNSALIARAMKQADIAEIQAVQSRLILTTSIASTYADLNALFADRDSADHALTVRTETLGLVQKRFTLGLETKAALKQVEASTATARAQLAEVDESIELTKAKLAALIGDGPDRGLQIIRPTAAALKPFGLPSTLALDLIGRRPDIVAARLTTESAAAGIKAAKADYYPNINLAASFAAVTFGFDFMSNSTPQIGRVGPAISLPIFDGGKRDGTYIDARGVFDEAVANYNQTVSQALSDVASVVISTRALGNRIDATEQAVNAAAESRDLAIARYQGGLGSFLNVLTAEDSLIVNQRVLADLKSRRFSLDITLIRALGGGFKSA